MDLQQELQLIEESKSDFKKFDVLYRAYVHQIFNYILNRSANKELAEDITSQTFLKAIDKLHKFDVSRGIGIRPWLYRISHNLLIDYYRKNKFLNVDEKIFVNVVGEAKDLDHEVTKEEIGIRVVEILSQLKPKYQWILSLRFYSEMTNSEIADEMDKKISYVNVQIHRALKSFKKKYLQKYPKSEILDFI